MPPFLRATVLDALDFRRVVKRADKVVLETCVVIVEFLRKHQHAFGPEFVHLWRLCARNRRDLPIGESQE